MTQTLNGLNVLTFTATGISDPSGTGLASTRAIPINFSTHAVFFVHRPLQISSAYNAYGNQNLLSIARGGDRITYPLTTGSTVSRYSNSLWGEIPGRDVSTAYNLRTVNVTPDSIFLTLNGRIENNTLYGGFSNFFSFDCSVGIGARPTTTGFSNFYVGNAAEIIVYKN
jgi:hypothetical protein